MLNRLDLDLRSRCPPPRIEWRTVGFEHFTMAVSMTAEQLRRNKEAINSMLFNARVKITAVLNRPHRRRRDDMMCSRRPYLSDAQEHSQPIVAHRSKAIRSKQIIVSEISAANLPPFINSERLETRRSIQDRRPHHARH